METKITKITSVDRYGKVSIAFRKSTLVSNLTVFLLKDGHTNIVETQATDAELADIMLIATTPPPVGRFSPRLCAELRRLETRG